MDTSSAKQDEVDIGRDGADEVGGTEPRPRGFPPLTEQARRRKAGRDSGSRPGGKRQQGHAQAGNAEKGGKIPLQQKKSDNAASST